MDAKQTKSVSIMTTGQEKDRFTVMLACLEDVTKLPPYVVFKRKTLPKDLVLPRGIHVCAQGVNGRITCETLAGPKLAGFYEK